MAKNKGLIRLYKAFLYSLDGLKAAFKTEAAFRQELCLGIVVALLLVWGEWSSWQRGLIILSYGLVLIAELINSAIEAVVDLSSPDYHDLAKKAKDIGSAAVLLALLNLAIQIIFIG